MLGWGAALALTACGGTPPAVAPAQASPSAGAAGDPMAGASPAGGEGGGRADPSLLPRKLLFGNPHRHAPKLSPSGRHLAWLAPKDGVMNVDVAARDDLASAQAESDQIVNTLKAKQLPVTYLLFPDEAHGFARPENRLAFFAVAEAFLAQHLGGAYQPIGDDFAGSSVSVPHGAEQVAGVAEALRAR